MVTNLLKKTSKLILTDLLKYNNLFLPYFQPFKLVVLFGHFKNLKYQELNCILRRNLTYKEATVLIRDVKQNTIKNCILV